MDAVSTPEMWAEYTLVIFVGGCALHSVARHLFPARNSVLTYLLTGLIGALALGLLLESRNRGRLEMAASLASYGFLCELYLFLFTFAISSVSVGTLLRLSGGGSHIPADTASPAKMTGNRLARMVESGLLRREGESFGVTGRGRLVLAVYRALVRIFGHDLKAENAAIQSDR